MKSAQFGVVGAGQMGSGIAQVAAQNGFYVYITDISEEALDNSKKNISASLSKLLKKGSITSLQADQVIQSIEWTTQLKLHQDASIVVEAVSENESLKSRVLKELDSILNDNSILASNTSSISITKLAAYTKRPDRFVGMHFMNPVPLMPLVELIRGLQTSDATYQHVLHIVERLGKTAITSQDYPGFIVNRILMPMINEAFFALMEGLAHKEDIDNSMKLGTNHPMGPLALADFIGLDTCLSIMEVLHQELGDSKYRPCPLLRNHVHAGLLGKKTGQGVYTY